MAAQAFHKEYWECMEEYLDENGHKNGTPFPEGKKRRSAIKGVLLGIMYGRGTASVAESIHSTPEEAQKIIDDFFEAYPKIKVFVEKKNKEAKEKGYTETAWGRRRYLKHIQDETFEYHYNNNRPINFNPLFTHVNNINKEVSQDIKDKYNDLLAKATGYNKKKIIEQAKIEGIDIIDNSKYIADAGRQVVNSTIQGSAADITKIAMIRIGQNEELKQLGYKMLFPVHDEIIAECPFENRKRCAELMSQIMIDSAAEKIDVPMKCDVEIFAYWYGPDISPNDSDVTTRQYQDFLDKGIYKEEKEYVI